MRPTSVDLGAVRVEDTRRALVSKEHRKYRELRLRTFVNIGSFFAAFVFTVGLLVLAILLWVRPDTLLPLVLIGVCSAFVFVAVFALVRFVTLHHVLSLERPEDDESISHHFMKSVSYGFVALVLALLLGGILIQFASATTFL